MAEKEPRNFKVVADNRRARYEFEIGEVIEAGIALTGTEVKSLRTGKATDALYQPVRDLLGEKGAVELTGLIGYYSLLAMQLNVFRVEPPEGTTIPWW